MLIDIVHTFRLGEIERKFLTDLIKQSESSNERFIQIEQYLKEINKTMLTQAQADKLASDLRAASAVEKQEVLDAIASTQVDTTDLEAAVEEVKDIFTPETDEEELPIDEETEETTPMS